MNIDDVSVELQENEAKLNTRKHKRTKSRLNKKHLTTFLFIVLWAAMVYGVYWYVDGRLNQIHQQINRSIVNVQENNNHNIKELEDKLSSVQKEMQNISWTLEQTGKEVSSSGSSTREELNKRIKELDNRLGELTKSLEILKESKGEIR